ncbi:ribonuclease H-like domain-containing protein [Tanacetum coccineum]
MVTRFCVGTNRPTERLNLHVSSVSPLPQSYRDAFSDPNWQNAMLNEYHTLIKNKTWTLVPRPTDTNIAHCMWLFYHKYRADGRLSRYKARLVANGSTYKLIDASHQEFAMTDLGPLNYFLGISVSRDSSGLFLSQKKYVVEILNRAHMVNFNPIRTPIDTESKLGSDGDPPVSLYIMIPEPHFSALKRILRYVRGTLDYGLQLFSSSTTVLVAYSDADWAGCPTTRRSTSGVTFRIFRSFSTSSILRVSVNGTLSRYKARLVANGSTQLKRVDVDETFNLVVKPGTIRIVLSLVASRHWLIHQLDVKNAFLHGDLSKTVYMHQPPGFWDYVHPDYVCLLQRSLYGLKQTPRAWFQRFASYITRVGFSHSRCDSSLFIYRQGTDTAYLLLYVDDIVLTASSEILLQQIIRSLHQEFAMTDLGSLNYFLGISVSRDSSGLFLSQKKYAVEILNRAHMVNCNPSRTPIDTESKLGSDGDPVSDPTLYRSLAGSLQYLTFTRPDISYAVQQVCLYMHDPREPHFSALKRILRYVRGTLDYGLQLFSSSTTDLVAYSDADWAGCPTTRRSTFGYCVFLGNNLLSWSSKRQSTLSRSNSEAEYRGVANAVRTKQIEIDIHFVRDLVAAGQVCVLHVPSHYQFTDIFTKGLSSALFEEFRSSLSVWCPPAPTAEEC